MSPLMQRPRLEVVRSGVEPVVPKQGDVVTARVIRINPRLAAGAPAGQSAGGRWQRRLAGGLCRMLGLRAACRTCLSNPPPAPSSCAVDILCVGPKPVQQRYSGVIRVQDVRATEIDKVGSGGVTIGCWPATAGEVEGCWGRVATTGSPGCTPTHPPSTPLTLSFCPRFALFTGPDPGQLPAG